MNQRKIIIVIIVILSGIFAGIFFIINSWKIDHKMEISHLVVENYGKQNVQADLIVSSEHKKSKNAHVLESLGLIDIRSLDTTIGVDLKYATTDNFTQSILYEDLDAAFLQPEVALMLANAQQYLRGLRPELRLLVYDAVRPLSVQRAMWKSVQDKIYRNYVAHPDKTGLHNYGAAVDITVADSTFSPLDMGTPFDFFGKAAGIVNEQESVESGLLTQQQVQNRQLLRQVMRHAGFRSINGEWWHFNACSLSEAKQRYPLVEDF